MEEMLVQIGIFIIAFLFGYKSGFNIFKFKLINTANKEYNILEIKIDDIYEKYAIRKIV